MAAAASTSLVILADRVGERARPQQQLREIDCGGGTSERGAEEEDFGNFLRTLRLPHKRRERGRAGMDGGDLERGIEKGISPGDGEGEGRGRSGFVNTSKKLNHRQKGVESPRIHHKGWKTGVTGHFRAIDQIAIYCPFGRRSGAVATSRLRARHPQVPSSREGTGRSILGDFYLRRGSVWLSESYRNATM